MNDAFVFFGIGISVLSLGILLLRREIRMFKKSVKTTATVSRYYDYLSLPDDNNTHRITMYTMAVQYALPDGTLIQASEQKGSSTKKYAVGTQIKIAYSRESPQMFVVSGDNSRKAVMIGMAVVGAAMVVLSVFMYIRLAYPS